MKHKGSDYRDAPVCPAPDVSGAKTEAPSLEGVMEITHLLR